jgi:ubiquinone/menaquinone biosynthesis C-methylase UbiE
LWLPQNTFKKVWILNTLHEIPDKQKMIHDIYNIVSPGGELIILEVIATEKHPVHGGCHKPLLSRNEIEMITAANGFSFKEDFINPVNVKKMKNPMHMIRYIKK